MSLRLDADGSFLLTYTFIVERLWGRCQFFILIIHGVLLQVDLLLRSAHLCVGVNFKDKWKELFLILLHHQSRTLRVRIYRLQLHSRISNCEGPPDSSTFGRMNVSGSVPSPLLTFFAWLPHLVSLCGCLISIVAYLWPVSMYLGFSLFGTDSVFGEQVCQSPPRLERQGEHQNWTKEVESTWRAELGIGQ